MKNLPRGISNNNPCNIRHSKCPWQGMAVDQPDNAFVRFIAPVWGIRAAGLIFSLYNKKYGLNTIRGYISRWAPPTENDTEAYVNHVCGLCNAQADEPYSVFEKDKLIALLKAVCLHENGKTPNATYPKFWYSDYIYSDAAEMVLSEMKKRENAKNGMANS